MTSAAYPTVYAALVAVATSAMSSLRVVDGFDLSLDPADVMMIGVPSLGDVNAISAGSFTQEASAFGRANGPRTETGTISGVVMARNGQGDQSAARVAAFGYLDTLSAALRADPTLGITTLTDPTAQLTAGDIAEDQVDGATTAISFTVTYRAFI